MQRKQLKERFEDFITQTSKMNFDSVVEVAFWFGSWYETLREVNKVLKTRSIELPNDKSSDTTDDASSTTA